MYKDYIDTKKVPLTELINNMQKYVDMLLEHKFTPIESQGIVIVSRDMFNTFMEAFIKYSNEDLPIYSIHKDKLKYNEPIKDENWEVQEYDYSLDFMLNNGNQNQLEE